MKKKTIILFLMFVLITTIALPAYGMDFGDLEGVIILNQENEDNISEDAADSEKEGVILSIKDCRIEPADDLNCSIILDASLMNWDTTSYNISDTVSSVLVYEDEYQFPGIIDFGEITQINMLEEITGSITYTVPNIVALAENDSIAFEMTVSDELYNEEIDLKASSSEIRDEINVPFEYSSRESDNLELKPGTVYVADTYKGETDEKYKWIIQEIFVINWSENAVQISDSAYALLTFMEQYGFEAQIEFPREQLNSLEAVQGILVFHVPVIVTESDDPSMELQITLQEENWSEEFIMKDAVKIDDWEYVALNLAGYTKLEYIEGTGNQYIDTGWKDEEGIMAEYRATWEANTIGLDGGYIVGSHNVSSPYGRNGGYYLKGNWELGFGDHYPRSRDLPFQEGEVYDISFGTVSGNGYLEVNGVRLITDTSEQNLADGNIFIFNSNIEWAQEADSNTCGKLYYLKLYDHNGTIVRDYVPCLRQIDEEPGLFDYVTNEFYPSEGTESFVEP